MNYQAWSQTLQKVQIQNGTTATAVWYSEPSDKPLAIFVHGLSGDRYGLIPLTYELSVTYRIAIVELPGHGDSDAIPLPDAASLERWFATTLASIVADVGKPAFICTHSFAALAVLDQAILKDYAIILLNPVPSPSKAYIWYAKMTMHTARLGAWFYNWRPFVYMRGLIVTRVRTKAARQRVNWVGYHSRMKYRQVMYQSRLIRMALDSSVYQYAGHGRVALVVCGKADVIPLQRDETSMAAVFEGSKIVFIQGGHIMPIESPDQVAAIIKSSMVH